MITTANVAINTATSANNNMPTQLKHNTAQKEHKANCCKNNKAALIILK